MKKILLFIVCFLSFNCYERKSIYFPKIPNVGDIFVERYTDYHFKIRESNENFIKFRAVSESYSDGEFMRHTFVYVTVNPNSNKVLSIYSKTVFAGEWD